MATSAMKLVTVLLLVALPLCCYAGSGCQLLESVIDKCMDPEVSKTELKEFLQMFITDAESAVAVDEFKQCFLNQSNETLTNARQMMDIIYNSIRCSLF